MKGLVLVLASVVVLVSAGCAGQAETSGTSETTTYTESAVLKVSVLESGVILVDGAPATIEALDEALTGLDEANGIVWYYRENAQTEPPAALIPVMTQVLDAIAAHERPISFSSKPDFSDVINKTGQSEPRE